MSDEERNRFLTDFQDEISKEVFGISKAEAIVRGICLECKQTAMPNCYSAAGRREFLISGLCEKCFDNLFKPPHGES